MTQIEREYLNKMEERFKSRVADTREKLRQCTLPSELENLEMYINDVELGIDLVRQIRSDFEQFEQFERLVKEGETVQ